ncbi:hypothetical protein P7K49_005047 [Saguinus oedipus]|uniref:Uncharacterized protein n=1 Tax=Saguinus oedipus TaxID=9490 RepID=A0ABQ9W952_SAGOE|nr:hypothetical protein P7K49_005047 [Saguinus oedipus]
MHISQSAYDNRNITHARCTGDHRRILKIEWTYGRFALATALYFGPACPPQWPFSPTPELKEDQIDQCNGEWSADQQLQPHRLYPRHQNLPGTRSADDSNLVPGIRICLEQDLQMIRMD